MAVVSLASVWDCFWGVCQLLEASCRAHAVPSRHYNSICLICMGGAWVKNQGGLNRLGQAQSIDKCSNKNLKSEKCITFKNGGAMASQGRKHRPCFFDRDKHNNNFDFNCFNFKYYFKILIKQFSENNKAKQ